MHIEIQGCRGSVGDTEAFIEELQAFAAARDLACQAFDAAAVYGEMHLRSAVHHAVRSYRRGEATCNDLAMEMLLYASGCRQIRDAIDRVGIRGNEVILLAVGDTGIDGADGQVAGLDVFMEERGLIPDGEGLAGDAGTLDRFAIPREVREAIDTSMYGDLILEQVAMVDLHT